MTLDAYRAHTLDRIAAALGPLAGVHGAGRTQAAIALGVALLALWLGTVLATRLLAQTSAGAAFGLAGTWLALLGATHAVSTLYALQPAPQAAAAFVMLALMIFAASRWCATSVARGFGVWLLGGGFGGLIVVLLAQFWRLMGAL